MFKQAQPLLKIARKTVKRSPIKLSVIRKTITDPCVQPKMSRKAVAGRMSINSLYKGY